MTRARGALAALAVVILVVAPGVSACARRPSALPAVTHRWAVLAPAAAETLAVLGAAERVVAVGDWIVWPPELAALPRLGGYDAPNEEALAALGIDTLVTAASLAGRSGRERLTRLGIRVVELDTETLAGALGAIAELGRLADREAEAARLLQEIEEGLAAVARRSAGAPRRRVLVVVGREPLFIAGPGSHLDELLRIAGGANVAADLGSPYAQASLEAMLARRPEVIVDLSDNRRGAPRGPGPGVWSAWPFVPAVAEGRVWFVEPIRLSIPGPRLVESAELLAGLIHPERFGPPVPATLGSLPTNDRAVR